jgi:hypothetical protein
LGSPSKGTDLIVNRSVVDRPDCSRIGSHRKPSTCSPRQEHRRPRAIIGPLAICRPGGRPPDSFASDTKPPSIASQTRMPPSSAPRLQGRCQWTLQIVRRRARQRPAHRQACGPRGDRGQLSARGGGRRAAASTVRLHARPNSPHIHLGGPEDSAGSALTGRIERAVTELVVLLRSGVGQSIADNAWSATREISSTE